MKHRWLLAVAAFAVATPALAETIVIHAGSVLRDAAAAASGPATIVVTDGKIASVEDGVRPVPAGARAVELPNATVMPGLIDLHVHTTSDPSGEWWREAVETEGWATVTGVKNALATARAGFTTVRDLGGAPQAVFALRRAVQSNYVVGPRMVAAGQALSTIGGHGDVHGFRPEVMEALDGHNTCTGADQCAARVREAVRGGAEVIKFHATGGVLSQGDKSLGQAFTDEEMKSIITTAHDLGIKVAAHAHADAGILAATRAGVDSIEHGTFAGSATLAEMKARGTVLVPTLLAFKGIGEKLGKGFYTPAVEAKIRMAISEVGAACRRARALGVTVAFGTDSGVTDHGRNAEEFAMLVDKCGMPARDAIASATTVAAKVLSMESEIGRIAPGYSADLIAVSGNPLNDVRVLEKVNWTMVRGRIVP